MSQKNIDFGNYPDDPDADSIRSAFEKVQQNFTQLFAPTGAEAAVTSVNRTPGAGITVNAPTGNVVISANIACVQVHTSTLSIGRGTNGFQDTSITSSSQTLWVDLPDTIANVTNLNLLGAANIGGNANITGNIIAGNANLGNAVTANYFIGDGSLLTNLAVTGDKISNGSSNVSVLMNGNVTVGIGGTPNIAVFSAGGANLGNAVSANYFIGNGSLLTGISGGLGNLTASNVTLSANTATWPVNISATSTGSNYWFNAYGGNIQVDTYTDFYMYSQGIATDSGGNVFVSGGNDGDFGLPYVLKYNAAGTLLWAKSYTADINVWYSGESIHCDSTGNLILGIMNQDGSPNNVLKLDTNGNILWQAAPSIVELPSDITAFLTTTDSSNNTYTFLGRRPYAGFTTYGLLLVKFNSSGVKQWETSIEVTSEAALGLNWISITCDPAGNLWILASPTNAGQGTYVLKISSSGSLDFQRFLANTYYSTITFDTSGNIYLGGRYSDATNNGNGLITKLDSGFNILWSKRATILAAGENQYNIQYMMYDNGYLYSNDSSSSGIIVSCFAADTGIPVWQNLLVAVDPANDYVYSWYSYDNSSLLALSTDKILIPGALGGFDIQDMFSMVVPKDGSGTGEHDYLVYRPVTVTFENHSPVITTPTLSTSAFYTYADGATVVASSAGTYLNYNTNLYPAGIKEWSFTSNAAIQFPDGSTQPTAFNPINPTTIYDLTVTAFKWNTSLLALGTNAKATTNGIALGQYAGTGTVTGAPAGAVAIGGFAQSQTVGNNSVSIGFQAGYMANVQSVAIGAAAGAFNYPDGGIVAIGHQAGMYSMKDSAIAIGSGAASGFNTYASGGNCSIAIGVSAGTAGMANNAIVIDATGQGTSQAPAASSLVIKPIRNQSSGNVLYYDPVTGEITYSTGGGGGTQTTIPQGYLPNVTNTLALSDAGYHLYTSSVVNKTVYIPTNASVAFPIGSVISIVIRSTATVSVEALSGVTLYMAGSSTAGNRIIGGYGMATLLKTENDVWFISGTGVT